MKYLLIVLALVTALKASDTKPVMFLDITNDSSNYTNQIRNRISEIILDLGDYRVASQNSRQTAVGVISKEINGAFDDHSPRELGQFLITDKVISYSLENELHEYALTLFLTDPNTGIEESISRRDHLYNVDSIITYDVYDLLVKLLYNRTVNTRERLQRLPIEYGELNRSVGNNDNDEMYLYNIENRYAYMAIGLSYLTSKYEKGIGPSIGFRYREDFVIGINYQLIFKSKLSKKVYEDLDGYYLYDYSNGAYDSSYIKDYSITHGFSNDFYLNLGWNLLSFTGGVSLDTYITDVGTDLHSEQGDYGYSYANDNRFTKVGWNAGVILSPHGERAYYNFSVLFRKVSDPSVTFNFSIEI